jgi:glycosyltransferase involved in cell wall biosynthesis
MRRGVTAAGARLLPLSSVRSVPKPSRRHMTILLLTETVPSTNSVQGLFLHQLCKRLAARSLSCFAVTDAVPDTKLTSLEEVPVTYTKKRSEADLTNSAGRLSLLHAWCTEYLRRKCVVPRYVDQAVTFGRQQQVDLVWAVLQGQTLTQIAPQIAQRLDVPLVTQVCEPPVAWLAAKGLHSVCGRWTASDFDHVMRASAACAAGAQAMADEYQRRYGVRCLPVINGCPSAYAVKPDLTQFPRHEIAIGTAWTFHGSLEWDRFLHALDITKWQVRGRPVRLSVIGDKPPGMEPTRPIRFLGWRNQEETVQLLSECDVLYCSSAFQPFFADVHRQSIPPSFACYLAAGRPLIFHGPASSAIGQYISSRGAGLLVENSYSAAIYNAMCRIVDNPGLYQRVGQNINETFLADFNLEAASANFADLLGLAIESRSRSPGTEGGNIWGCAASPR